MNLKFSEGLLRRIARDPRFEELLVKNLGISQTKLPPSAPEGYGRKAFAEQPQLDRLNDTEIIDAEFEDIE